MSQMQQMPSESHMSCPYTYAHNIDKTYTQICVSATVTALLACLLACLLAHANLLLQTSALFC